MFTPKKTYLEYFSYDVDAPREKVRYFEENQANIQMLDFDERLEMNIDYCLCLFEIGRYERYLEKVDSVIESVIEENIYEYMQVPIYEDLLFKKAACYHNLYQFQKAEHLLIQLMRIAPNHPGCLTLLAYCKQKSEKDLFVMFKALAIVCLFMAVSITLARIILIEPFYDQYLSPFMFLRNGLLGLAVVLLLGQEILINIEIYKETRHFSWPWLNTIKDKFFSLPKK